MSNYKLSLRAVDDLASIYRYTFLEYGETQADTYAIVIEEAIVNLANNPELSRSESHIRSDYFSYLVGKHIVFLKKRKNAVFVVRIVHQQMKFEFHLRN